MTLREYQVSAVHSIHERLARHRSTLLVMATGTGKTRVFCEVIKRYTDQEDVLRVLVVAHRNELIQQAATDLRKNGVTQIGIEKGPHRSDPQTDLVVVGSVQTLKSARLRNIPADTFDLIVIDEAHRAVSPSYQAIIDHFAGAKVLGVTATPDRLDGKPLGAVFESVAFEYSIQEAIKAGYLVPIRSHQVTIEGLELGQVRRARGDLNQGDLAKQMLIEQHLHAVAAPLVELAGDRPTLVFAVDVAHAEALAECLNRYRPGSAAWLSGKSKRRSEVLGDFASGRIQYLVNCELFTEGWNGPWVECVAMARPTASRALFAQMIGRGTRLHPGKTDLLVLDFTGNAGRHQLVSTIDVLAGEPVAPDVRAAYQELAGLDLDGFDDLDLLALAQSLAETIQQEAEQRAIITAVADFYTTQIDPFLGPVKRPGRACMPTHEQAKALERAGIKFKFLNGMCLVDAGAIVDELGRRKDAGLCSYKMARWLTQQKIKNAHQFTAEQAKDAYATRMRQINRFAGKRG